MVNNDKVVILSDRLCNNCISITHVFRTKLHFIVTWSISNCYNRYVRFALLSVHYHYIGFSKVRLAAAFPTSKLPSGRREFWQLLLRGYPAWLWTSHYCKHFDRDSIRSIFEQTGRGRNFFHWGTVSKPRRACKQTERASYTKLECAVRRKQSGSQPPRRSKIGSIENERPV